MHALTDVTGFGLLGHLLEICRGAGLAPRCRPRRLPVMPAAVGPCETGHRPRRHRAQPGQLRLSVELRRRRRGLAAQRDGRRPDQRRPAGGTCDPASADEVLGSSARGVSGPYGDPLAMEAGLPKVHVGLNLGQASAAFRGEKTGTRRLARGGAGIKRALEGPFKAGRPGARPARAPVKG